MRRYTPTAAEEAEEKSFELQMTALRADRAQGNWKQGINPFAAPRPHPESYGADIPLQRFTIGQLQKPTSQELKEWAARPLRTRATGETEWSGPAPALVVAPAPIVVVAPIVVADVPRARKRAPRITANVAPKSAPASVPQNVRDSIRRAFVAVLNGRVQIAQDGSYLVMHRRTRQTKSATWNAIVCATFPTVQAFETAAHAWKSPSNARTLSTH